MRVLLDTTYLLPAIGISVKGVLANAAEQLITRGNEMFISEITLFELSAKGARYVMDGALAPERVTRGINAISYEESLTKLPCYETLTLRTAMRMREVLGDFIDCLILSSAANNCEVLVTEDDDIHALMSDNRLDDMMAALGSTCKIMRLVEVLRN